MIALRRDPPPNLPGGGWGFWLEPKGLEPADDPAWALASDALRARFWAEAGRVAAAAWDRSRALGLDRFGKKLQAIGEATKKARKDNVNRVTAAAPYSPMGRANPAAPPLTPVGDRSRTRSLLRHKTVSGRGVWFYWARDPHTGRYWGEILDAHARGFTRYFKYPHPARFSRVPSRDVIGFSPKELREVRRHMATWWGTRREKILAEHTAAPPKPRPGVATAGSLVDQVGRLEAKGKLPVWAESAMAPWEAKVSVASSLTFGGDRGAGVVSYRKLVRQPAAAGPPVPPKPPKLRPAAAVPPPLLPSLALEAEIGAAELVYLELLAQWHAMPAGPAADAFREEQLLPAWLLLRRLRRRRRGA